VGQLCLEVVDDKGEDQPGGVLIALVGGQGLQAAAQWWAANAPLLARVLDEHAYPLATRVGTAAGAAHGGAYDPEHAYRFGLQRVLDGLAVLIDRRS
jgi:hypothetical protein